MRGIKEVLARNLKINRLKLGLTQEKLAEKADISTQCLAMVELVNSLPPVCWNVLPGLWRLEPAELFYMPSVAENALERLEAVIAANIERVVAEAIEKPFPAHVKGKRCVCGFFGGWGDDQCKTFSRPTTRPRRGRYGGGAPVEGVAEKPEALERRGRLPPPVVLGASGVLGDGSCNARSGSGTGKPGFYFPHGGTYGGSASQKGTINSWSFAYGKTPNLSVQRMADLCQKWALADGAKLALFGWDQTGCAEVLGAVTGFYFW